MSENTDQVKFSLDNLSDNDFKELYVAALLMMSDDTHEGMLYVHSECLLLREQMEVIYEASVPPRRSIH